MLSNSQKQRVQCCFLCCQSLRSGSDFENSSKSLQIQLIVGLCSSTASYSMLPLAFLFPLNLGHTLTFLVVLQSRKRSTALRGQWWLSVSDQQLTCLGFRRWPRRVLLSYHLTQLRCTCHPLICHNREQTMIPLTKITIQPFNHSASWQ